MKATIEFDDGLYRRLKIEAARRGRTVRDLVQEGVRAILDRPEVAEAESEGGDPAWFGSLRDYASNAAGSHELDAIRRSIAAGRKRRGG
jgi:plasmid stability protein